MNNYNIIGFSGGTASGKTTMVSKLFNHYGKNESVIIDQDSYYKDQNVLSYEQRSKINYDHPDAIDFKLLYDNLISLINGKIINKPNYNHKTHTRDVNFEPINPKKIIFVEGTLVLHFKKITDLMLLKIFIHTSEKIRFSRRLERDINERGRDSASVYKQYADTVYPMHQKFVEPCSSTADMNISGEKNIKDSIKQIIHSIDRVLIKKN
ncbi:MAG: uridine kinase [Candidatus Marinimicrobia bacterium]|nr:uridine kinase [Candidatus Neomarinimicrobiota bacterium]|tara:strand:- start:2750 stop:3376 length:627 start_codon:yes stop_codon:yes gene_type:complete